MKPGPRNRLLELLFNTETAVGAKLGVASEPFNYPFDMITL